MEKISRIVRGNSRVASTDLKSAAAVRPGMPSFGRPVGESTNVGTAPATTAEKAVALHNEMLGKKKPGGEDKVIQQMADQFFMTRIARPEPGVDGQAPEGGLNADGAEEVIAPAKEEMAEAPSKKYVPRGSYVDVRA